MVQKIKENHEPTASDILQAQERNEEIVDILEFHRVLFYWCEFDVETIYRKRFENEEDLTGEDLNYHFAPGDTSTITIEIHTTNCVMEVLCKARGRIVAPTA